MTRSMLVLLLATSLAHAPMAFASGLRGSSNDGCASAGTFRTTSSTEDMEGGRMFCTYPTGTNMKFPLVSFEHGDTLGGFMLPFAYGPFLDAVASSGFVVCAPVMCLIACRERQHVHQLHAITAAKALGKKGVLPVRSEFQVGILGHSTGGMTTLKCAARGSVSEYGIGAAVVYNGDGPPGWIGRFDHVNFTDIEESLPIFMVTGTKDIIEPRNSTRKNSDAVLEANPTQPLIVAEIDGEGHLDSVNIPVAHPAPMKAVPFIISFLGYTLTTSAECTTKYKTMLGAQLKDHSRYWLNQLGVPPTASSVSLV